MDTNAALNSYWKQLGNSGERPVGWFGPGGSAEEPNYGANSPGFFRQQREQANAAYDDLLTKAPSATDFAAGLNAGIDDSFAKYLDYIKTSPTSLDFYQKNLEASGIPGLQKSQATLQGQIYDLEDTLRRVEPNVDQTTRESIVTNAQRSGMVEARQKPLVESLGWLGQSLGRVSSAVQQGKSDVLDLTRLNSADQARVDDAYKTGLDIAADNAARSMTGFTNDKETFLNVSLAKIARGEKISDTQAQQAFEMLKLEKQYQLEYDNQSRLEKLKAELNPPKASDKFLTLSEGSTVFDPVTGKAMYTAPKTYEPKSGTSASSVPVSTKSAKPTSSPSSQSNYLGVNPELYNYLYGSK